jgi:hypothetical protein
MDVTDFISPDGLLTTALFPGQNLETLVSAWLTEAEARAAAADTVERQTEAVAAWVYYRAYFDVWQRLSSNPSQLSLDGTSYGMGQDQINSYLTLWKSYKADYDAAMGLTRGEMIVSRSAKANATW